MNREERKSRRRAIARAVRNGESAYSVAERFGVTPDTVYKACAEFRVEIKTIKARPWANIDWTKDNATIARAKRVLKSQVSRWRHCYGVARRRDRGLSAKWLVVDFSRPVKEIAAEMGVSKQRVSQVKARLARRAVSTLATDVRMIDP